MFDDDLLEKIFTEDELKNLKVPLNEICSIVVMVQYVIEKNGYKVTKKEE